MEEHQEQLADADQEVATWKRKYDEAMLMVEERDEEIRKQKSEILKQRRQMIKRDAQIRAQITRLAQFICAKERLDFFDGAH